MHNLTCNNRGGGLAAYITDTSQRFYRGCTFNGPVQFDGYWISHFLGCTFNKPGGSGFRATGGACFALEDCTFTSGTPFSNPGNQACHIENTTMPAGYVRQLTVSD
jgi:hypothetical protein